MFRKIYLGIFSIIVIPFFVMGCSDSSDSASSDSGDLTLSITPNRLAVENIAFAELRFKKVAYDDLKREGLTFKFLLPAQVEYVKGSGVLVLDNGAQELEPLYYGATQIRDESTDETTFVPNLGSRYLIFTIAPGILGTEEDEGTIQFNIRGLRRTTAEVMLAVDLDRGATSTFAATAAGFTPEAESGVEVIPEDSAGV